VDAKTVFALCTVTFSKIGCDTVCTELLFKNTYHDTLSSLIKKLVADAKIVVSHRTVIFSKIASGTVLTELLLKTHTGARSHHLYKTGGGCENCALTLHGHIFKKSAVISS